MPRAVLAAVSDGSDISL